MSKNCNKKKHFPTAQKEAAIRNSLEEDWRVLISVKQCLSRELKENKVVAKLLLPEVSDIEVESVKDWWRFKKLPKDYNFIYELISKGLYPIFFNISLLVESTAPTVYIPIPYRGLNESNASFKNICFLNINNNQVKFKENYDWDRISRKFSHALCNLSYSVKIGDTPTCGYLAKAHEDRKIVYEPDVSLLDDKESKDRLLSVARDDEKNFAMASVLYIPLEHKKILPLFKFKDKTFSKAVLMFWSPIPNFWKKGFAKPEDKEKIIHSLSDRLSWLGNYIQVKNTSNHANAVKHIGFLNLLKNHSAQLAPFDNERWEKVFKAAIHNLADLVSFIVKGEEDIGKRVLLKTFLKSLLLGQNSIVNLLNVKGKKSKEYESKYFNLRFKNLNENYIKKDYWGEAGVIKFCEEIEITGRLKIGEKIGLQLAKSPFYNMDKFMDSFVKCEIILSKEYLTIRYYQIPTEDAKTKLDGIDGFKRYYALRRGLSIPTTNPGDHGLGFALFQTLGTISKIHGRLYYSSDHRILYDEISFPIES